MNAEHASASWRETGPAMSGWTPDELRRIGQAEELGIASRRPDGTLRRRGAYPRRGVEKDVTF